MKKSTLIGMLSCSAVEFFFVISISKNWEIFYDSNTYYSGYCCGNPCNG